tara:strand:- start:1559 stop:1975 length:417 start_codon:yes stop_codon:yes gene_type:complete
MIKLDHIAVGVSNLDAAIDFYEQKIGLKFLFKKVDEAHGEAFAYLEMEGGRLELLQSLHLTKHRAVDDHSFCPHMAFASNDLYATEKDLRKKQVVLLKGPMEIPGMVRWLYAADLDGNVLEFVQWVKGVEPDAQSKPQ